MISLFEARMAIMHKISPDELCKIEIVQVFAERMQVFAEAVHFVDRSKSLCYHATRVNKRLQKSEAEAGARGRWGAWMQALTNK